MSSYRFRKGDVVIIDHKCCPSWALYKTGVIHKSEPYLDEPMNKYSTGYGSREVGPFSPNWKIRLDGFDYGESPDNCHTVSEDAISHALPEVTQDEVDQAIQSIARSV